MGAMEEAEENDLAQYENDDNELELVQTNVDSEHRNIEFMTDTADFLMQADSETLDGLGQTLVQTQSSVEDFLSTMQPETAEAFDNMYAQVRDNAYDWLAQI